MADNLGITPPHLRNIGNLPSVDSKGAAGLTKPLNKYVISMGGGTVTFKEDVWAAIEAILAQEVKRVIGEDDKHPAPGNLDYAKVRNQLRAEQRRKAGLV